jgi:lipopolysaccharide heptosyltransferase II
LNILIVRLREIGDVVFTTPALRAIRQRFPDARIAYLVEPLAAPVVALSPHLDEFIVAPRAGFASDLRLGLELRTRRFDLAIDFHGGPRASMLTWLSGAPQRIGYAVRGRGWMYTSRIPRPRELRPRHAVRNQWDLLELLQIAPPGPESNPVEMPVDPLAAAALAARLESCGLEAGDRLVAVHVSAGNPFRRWPPDAFAEAAAALVTRHPDVRVLIVASAADRETVARVVSRARERLTMPQQPRVFECTTCSLDELRALFDRAALFIGGDSGPLHIAATSAVPIVALFGPTLPVRSGPWRNPAFTTETVDAGALECRPCDQRVCAPGDFRCLTRITPSAVVLAAERALARPPVVRSRPDAARRVLNGAG